MIGPAQTIKTPLDIQWQMKDQENQHSISCIPRSWRCRWQRIRRERKTKETDYSMNNQIGLSSTDTPSSYIHVHLVCWTWLKIRVTDHDQTRRQAIAEYWPSSLLTDRSKSMPIKTQIKNEKNIDPSRRNKLSQPRIYFTDKKTC